MEQFPDSFKPALMRLMETSQYLHGALVASPLWEMLKTEPVVANWILALGEVESFTKSKQPDEKMCPKCGVAMQQTGSCYTCSQCRHNEGCN